MFTGFTNIGNIDVSFLSRYFLSDVNEVVRQLKIGVSEATNAEKTDNGFLKTNILGHFSIQIAENAWKRPFFDTPYLGNRLELRDKWAHSEKKMSRATTYVKTKKIWDFDPDPPLSP